MTTCAPGKFEVVVTSYEMVITVREWEGGNGGEWDRCRGVPPHDRRMPSQPDLTICAPPHTAPLPPPR